MFVLGLAAFACSGVSEALAQASAAPSLDRDAFLRAIAQVETGGNPRAIGSRGERGLYQFRRATWHQYTTRSFTDAHQPGVAYEIAVKHFDWLQARLRHAGRPVTAATMATAWNSGFGRAFSGHVPRSTRDYAHRVKNLVAVYERPTPVPATQLVAATGPKTVPDSLAQIPALRFSVDEPAAKDRAAPEVVLLGDGASEVSFSLSPPTEGPKRLRFIFATIGE